MITFEPIQPRPSACELWLVDLRATGATLDAIEAQTPRLSPQQQASISDNAKLRDRAANKRHTHIALRIVLERTLGPTIRNHPLQIGVGGKPALAPVGSDTSPTSVAFSLSHAADVALIGVSTTGPIGVDVESQRQLRMPDDRQKKIIAAAERLVQNSQSPSGPAGDLEVLQAWVRLEAWAKLDGAGIGRLLTQLGIVGGDHTDPAGGIISLHQLVAQQTAITPGLRVADVDAGEGRFAAVAVQPNETATGDTRPRLHRFPYEAEAIAAVTLG